MDSTLKKLIDDLQADNASIRATAAEELCLMESAAKSVASQLIAACADEDEQVREWVIGALEGLGKPLVSDLPKLSELLKHPDMNVGYWAATLIGRLAK